MPISRFVEYEDASPETLGERSHRFTGLNLDDG